jgi:hypothetical protein
MPKAGEFLLGGLEGIDPLKGCGRLFLSLGALCGSAETSSEEDEQEGGS